MDNRRSKGTPAVAASPPTSSISVLNDGALQGIATVTSTYDALGPPTQLAHFGRDGQGLLDKDGVASTKLTYDQHGNLQEVAFVGTDGQLITQRLIGAAGRSFRYDAHGNIVESTFPKY